jgi:Protein of unknown function (DUF5672)
MIAKTEITVLVPVYKPTLEGGELRSFLRTVAILGDYAIAVIAPDGLALDFYTALYPALVVHRFDKQYFTGIDGYNKLLASPFFYRRFRPRYRYMLICQTDAYVFRDELADWCNKGYDYIGPPWLTEPPKRKKRNLLPLSKWMVGRVGNGGFSLRNIRSHWINALIFKPFSLLNFNEDFFWCMIVHTLNPWFRIPGVPEALAFGFEMEPARSLELNCGALPFGCHAWEKYGAEFWATYI